MKYLHANRNFMPSPWPHCLHVMVRVYAIGSIPPPFENPRHVSSVSVGIHFSYSLSQVVF